MATTAWQLAGGPVREARRPRTRPAGAWAAVALAVVLAAWSPAVWPAGADAASGGGAGSAPVRVVLRPGDTVWDLARLHAPAGTSHTVYVRRVLAANDVDPAALRPGAVLVLPG